MTTLKLSSGSTGFFNATNETAMEYCYNEIVIDPAGNTYVGPLAQRFAYGALKLPKVFVLDSETELFHVFEIMPDNRVVERAAVSSRATAQNYMSPDRICVYKRYPSRHSHKGLGAFCQTCGASHLLNGISREMERNNSGEWTFAPLSA